MNLLVKLGKHLSPCAVQDGFRDKKSVCVFGFYVRSRKAAVGGFFELERYFVIARRLARCLLNVEIRNGGLSVRNCRKLCFSAVRNGKRHENGIGFRRGGGIFRSFGKVEVCAYFCVCGFDKITAFFAMQNFDCAARNFLPLKHHLEAVAVRKIAIGRNERAFSVGKNHFADGKAHVALNAGENDPAVPAQISVYIIASVECDFQLIKRFFFRFSGFYRFFAASYRCGNVFGTAQPAFDFEAANAGVLKFLESRKKRYVFWA